MNEQSTSCGSLIQHTAEALKMDEVLKIFLWASSVRVEKNISSAIERQVPELLLKKAVS
jgi:hypothetical protein